MAKITLEVRECKIKLSSECTGTFQRMPQRGRPPVACPACAKVRAEVKAPTRNANDINLETMERKCGCGATFQVKPGRGRKAEKCDACRAAGTVYRRNDEGILEEIRAEALRREQEEKKEEAGKIRAQNLFDRMQPLLAKRSRELIVH